MLQNLVIISHFSTAIDDSQKGGRRKRIKGGNMAMNVPTKQKHLQIQLNMDFHIV